MESLLRGRRGDAHRGISQSHASRIRRRTLLLKSLDRKSLLEIQKPPAAGIGILGFAENGESRNYKKMQCT